ncbi:hypothetical protein Asppvi_011127 [Aspergillus pseudoviridinutans]|uniref:Uncharacterized protein n=1 Tax=Aspergillus pseudoviridinutans TaxID=1517512 RepID=A0A9P3BR32_9EURO|nr:uncharacterized protein Asppvi_011127 [Aspergillus pseudoviridinutans]GIJ92151.1 hypothetical protein Asppvi_011127 [Aspergillus pseudoviridinutans]
MRFLPNHILKALLAVSMVTTYAGASPHDSPAIQVSIFDEYANNDDHHMRHGVPMDAEAAGNWADSESAGPPLFYGSCYRLSSDEYGRLGGDNGVWSYLQFGQEKSKVFKVCHKQYSCHQHQGSVQAGMDSKPYFYLWDFEGSKRVPRGNYLAVAGPDKFFAAGSGYCDVIRFRGDLDYNYYQEDDYSQPGVSKIRLTLAPYDTTSTKSGLTIDGAKNLKRTSAGNSVRLNFHPVACPVDEDD